MTKDTASLIDSETVEDALNAIRTNPDWNYTRSETTFEDEIEQAVNGLEDGRNGAFTFSYSDTDVTLSIEAPAPDYEAVLEGYLGSLLSHFQHTTAEDNYSEFRTKLIQANNALALQHQTALLDPAEDEYRILNIVVPPEYDDQELEIAIDSLGDCAAEVEHMHQDLHEVLDNYTTPP